MVSRAQIRTERGVEVRLTLSIPETAQLLGISRGLAYDLARRGEIPTLQFGRRRVVPRAALDALLDSSSQ